MIAKALPSGPGFGALVEYVVAEGRELLAWTSDNVLSLASVATEMEAVAAMNPYIQGETERALLHFTLAWPPNEKPSADTIVDVALGAVRRLGFSADHQVAIVVHNDSPTGHYHAHVIVNRVNATTYRMHHPGLYRVKLDRYMREVELKNGWHTSPGLHRIEGTKEAPTIVRQRSKPRIKGAAKDGALQTGLPNFGQWLTSVAGEALKDVVAEPEWTFADLRRALRRFNSEILPYDRGYVIRDIDEPKVRVGARAVLPALTAASVRLREADDEPDSHIAPIEHAYREQVRDFLPDQLRDEYEQLRKQWHASEPGQAARRERNDFRKWRKRERDRLRSEERRAMKKLAGDDDRAALLSIAFDLKRDALERRIALRQHELIDMDKRFGRPADTYFKWRRERQGDTTDANLYRIISGTGTTDVPLRIGGLERRPGTRGFDFIRDGMRVLTIRDDQVILTSKEPLDVELALKVARRSLSGPLRASGDPRFVRATQTAITTRPRPGASRS